MPELFDGVELGGIRRQRDKGNIFGYLDFFRGMKAGLIPDHKHLHLRIDLLFKLPEEGIDGLHVEIRSQEAHALAGLRAGGSKDVEVFILGLPPGRRPDALSAPLAGEGALLAKAGFILKPDFYSFSRMISTELPDQSSDFFLKASRASGSPLGCSGREETWR